MATTLARLSGVMLRPGVSRNGRYYSSEMIARAVERAQARIDTGAEPLTMLTHHDAEDDSEKIVGALRKVWLSDDGSVMYEAELANTKPAQTIATLADTSGDAQPYLRGVSLRGYWVGEPRTVEMQGRTVVTCDDMELDGLDFTRSPGVPGARVDSLEFVGAGAPAESGTRARYRITESVQEARMIVAEEATAEAKKASDEPYGDVDYADPGYQSDGKKRYPLDSKDHVRAAWSYINQAKNAGQYSADQLSKIKGRIKSAAKKFDIQISSESSESREARVPEEETAPACDGRCCSKCGMAETAKETAPAGPVQRWADHGYRPGGGKAFPLDTKSQARESWRALRGRKAAADYTPAQLLRMRERANKALARHGVTVMPNGWLMEAKPATQAQVREYLGDVYYEPCGPRGSFCVTVDNGVVCVTIYSHTIDPSDLCVVARAAMDGACNALEAMDPDNDGDVDVPGMTSEAAPDALSAAETENDTPAGVSESDTDPAAAEAASEPSPDSAPVEKDSIEEEGEPGMAEPTTTPAAGAPAVTLSAEQFEALMGRLVPAATAPVESAPAAPVVEAAPVEESADARDARIAEAAVKAFIAANPALAPAAPAAPVEETQDQRDARVAEAAVRAFVQTQAEQGGVGGRKGIVVDRGTEGPRESADGVVVPEGVRDVPAHQWTQAEWKIVRAQMGLEAAGLAGEPRG